jgi:hypothetical protein
MSACSNFKAGAWKKDECRECFQKKSHHESTSTSTIVMEDTTSDHEKKVSLPIPHKPSPPQVNKNSNATINRTRTFENVQSNTAIGSDFIPSNIHGNNSQANHPQNRSTSAVSTVFVNIQLLAAIEQATSTT